MQQIDETYFVKKSEIGYFYDYAKSRKFSFINIINPETKEKLLSRYEKDMIFHLIQGDDDNFIVKKCHVTNVVNNVCTLCTHECYVQKFTEKLRKEKLERICEK